MIANRKIKIDGVTYEKGEELPDFGSIVVIDNVEGVRSYEGLSQDVDKLPTYCGSGSSFLALDKGDYYKFHAPTKTWYKL